MLILVNLLDDKDLKASRDTFHAMDFDNSGLISVDELRVALKNINTEKFTDDQIEEMIRKIDYD